MRSTAAALVAIVCLGSVGARQASASPITWSATGMIDSVSGTTPPWYEHLALPGFIIPGLPWTLTFTFDPQTPAVQRSCSNSFFYGGAISETRFQLGGFTYTHTQPQAADIFTNADLPATGCGGGGIVQFHWNGGVDQWVGNPGAPILRTGLMIASYFDEQACNGMLPAVPGPFPSSCTGQFLALGGLALWSYPLSFGGGTFVSSSTFSPSVVPEPGTWVLLGSGLAVAAFRRRASRRRR